MFAQNDPRATISPAAPAIGTTFAGAQYSRFDTALPHDSSDGARHWYSQAQNFVVAWTEADAGAVIERHGQQDEQLLVLPDAGTEVEASAGGQKVFIPGPSVVFLPPGDTAIRVIRGGRLIRAVTRRSAADLVSRIPVGEDHTAIDPNATPFKPWPKPMDGYAIRVYPMEAEPKAGSFGRVWRCSSFLVLYVAKQRGARDASKLSPHAHQDFQQCNVVLDGEFSFNMRWPWVENKTAWRKDEHELVRAPGVVMIPAQAIHTTQRLSEGDNFVFDIYAPPRTDFAQAGWALNGDEYPMPSPTKR